jgi:phosphoglycolate phosphatase
LKYFIFDLDGTLCDSARGIRGSFLAAFRELGLPTPRLEQIEIGPPLGDTIRRLLKNKADTHFDLAIKTYRKHYAKNGVFESDLYPGILEILHKLKNGGHKLYVATAKLEHFAHVLLKDKKLDGFFEKIYGSRENGELTLKSDLVSFLLSENPQIQKENAFMIGDRRHDIEAALLNGITPLAVLWGYGAQEELQKAGALHYLKQVSDLEAWIA